MAQVFEFTEAFCAGCDGIAHEAALAIDFAVEELFTNLVKYQPGPDPIDIALELVDAAPDEGGRGDGRCALVTISGTELRPFDPTRTPDAPVDRPASEREAGGLGLHLVRRMVRDFRYEHDPASGIGRARLRVPLQPERRDADSGRG